MPSRLSERVRASQPTPPRKQPLPVVIALVRDLVGRSRLQNAFASHARLRFCLSQRQLLQLSDAEPPDMVIVEPRDEAGLPNAAVITALRRARPTVRALVYCRLEPDDCHELPALGRAGASAVVFRDFDDKGPALRDVVDAAQISSCARAFVERLQRISPPAARGVVAYCARHASPKLSVEGLAFAFGVTRRTLVNRFARAGLPPPRTLVTWCRLLQATCDLSGQNVMVKETARIHGFGTGTTFRRVLRHHTGLRIADLRADGAVDVVIDGLLSHSAFPGLRRTA